jgi:hypothetical protein
LLRLRLSKGAPDLELGLDVPDDLVGELRACRGAAEVRRPDAVEDDSKVAS